MIEARGSIDAKRYPKNLANLEAALETLGGLPEEPRVRERTADDEDAASHKDANAFALVTSALAAVASLYVGVTGFLSGHLVFERRNRSFLGEFDGLSAQIASLGLIIFALDLALTTYMMVAKKSFTGPTKLVANIGWTASLGLIFVAILIRS